MDDTTTWLLSGPPWVQLRTRLDLLRQPPTHPEVLAARQAMLAHPLVRGLVDELARWPGQVLSSHKSAGQLFHKLAFVGDLGLRASDAGVDTVVQRVMAHQSAEGPFQLPMNIGVAYGGTGQDIGAWALCDAPVIVYGLLMLGMDQDPSGTPAPSRYERGLGVQRAVDYLAGLVRDNGWPCVVSKELGRWRGPGRKDDPCPYATLVMLKLLARVPRWRDSHAAQVGAASLLDLWEHSRERHPYVFYMGTDFRRLKAPFIWYDMLHVAEVLTQFTWLHGDPRLREMLHLLASKADAAGRYTPESVWKAWEAWDFGQKKQPSPWLTLLARRILDRVAD
jgi:hypothetical protein